MVDGQSACAGAPEPRPSCVGGGGAPFGVGPAGAKTLGAAHPPTRTTRPWSATRRRTLRVNEPMETEPPLQASLFPLCTIECSTEGADIFGARWAPRKTSLDVDADVGSIHTYTTNSRLYSTLRDGGGGLLQGERVRGLPPAQRVHDVHRLDAAVAADGRVQVREHHAHHVQWHVGHQLRTTHPDVLKSPCPAVSTMPC